MKKKTKINAFFAAIGMLTIILDTETARNGAAEGIDLCIKTVIPSLFPFFILSAMVCSNLLGQTIPFLRPIGKLCKIPVGAESILLLGLTAGYPVGAQLITEAYKEKALSKDTAKRMLGFCNNAGPAFIFGMVALLFERNSLSWILWLIHLLSALIVGFVLPYKTDSSCVASNCKPQPVAALLESSIKTMGTVCGWIIVFRIILAFCTRWFLWRLPMIIQVLLIGLIELSNGCFFLQKIPQESTRFLIASFILSAGGVSVWMQTRSVTGNMGTGFFLTGKVLQCLFSVGLSSLCIPFLFPNDSQFSIVTAILFLLVTMIIVIFLLNFQKSCSNRRKNAVYYLYKFKKGAI